MISNEDIKQLELMFVTRHECQDVQEVYDGKLNENNQNLIIIKTKLNMLLGILGAIGVAVLGIAVELLFGG